MSEAVSERSSRDVGSPVSLLITIAAIASTVAVALTLTDTVETIRHDWLEVVVFLVLALVLQLFSVEVYGRGSIGVSAVGLLAAGFSLGPGPAMVIGLLAAASQWARKRAARKRGLLHRAIFDAANFTLSAGVGAFIYAQLAPIYDTTAMHLAVATLAGLVYSVVNNGLLCVAMSLSESLPLLEVWRERFHWARYHFLAFGPLAVASSIAYEKTGVTGMLAFALPPAMLVFSVKQYLERTRVAVEEVRQANHDLRLANAQLAERAGDLQELFQFAGGLAARAHDRASLVRYAEDSLSRLTGGRARIECGPGEGGIGLVAGGSRVGGLALGEGPGFDGARWERLGDAILPQLATAIESSELVEQVRKKHLATIAALSRSMEAKDYYTGSHTERVSDLAVALGRRLGYTGAELDAIEIGSLLHDIGKIGIPERILHKPGPLDDDEWKVMKEHPVISDYILSEVDLHRFVREIARSSHERMDGKGYPDGLRGEDIPLPARIALVADAWDALTSDRPYRRGRSVQAALEEMRAHSGTQFCPRVMEALEKVYVEEPHLLGTALRAVEAA